MISLLPAPEPEPEPESIRLKARAVAVKRGNVTGNYLQKEKPARYPTEPGKTWEQYIELTFLLAQTPKRIDETLAL